MHTNQKTTGDYTSENIVPTPQMNRREKERVQWNEPIEYRRLHSDIYKKGLLVNISTTGALLWLMDSFSVGNKLEILMPSDSETLHLYLNVVRTEQTQFEGYSAFGCTVEMALSNQKS